MVKVIETILHDVEDSAKVTEKAIEMGYPLMNGHFGKATVELSENNYFLATIFTRFHKTDYSKLIETIKSTPSGNVFGLYRVN